MTRFIAEADRIQITFLLESLDAHVEVTNPIHAIDAFVAHLNLAELGFDVVPEATGRPGYHPSLLLGRLILDDRAIADFRTDTPSCAALACPSSRYQELS